MECLVAFHTAAELLLTVVLALLVVLLTVELSSAVEKSWALLLAVAAVNQFVTKPVRSIKAK